MYLAVDLEEHQEPSQGKEQTRLSQYFGKCDRADILFIFLA